jgi:hypothetical protein
VTGRRALSVFFPTKAGVPTCRRDYERKDHIVYIGGGVLAVIIIIILLIWLL